MISEVWETGFDIAIVIESVSGLITHFPAKEPFAGYGGWSVLSHNGKVDSGWNEEAVVLNEQGEMDMLESAKKIQELQLPKSKEHIQPTPFLTEPLKKIVEQVSEKGLKPCRVRLSRLKAGSTLYWHQDERSDVYCVRLHIPLITNSKCFFETEEGKEHFAANGNAYFVKVNVRHRVINQGTTDRIHIIMDVRDELNFTQHHRYY